MIEKFSGEYRFLSNFYKSRIMFEGISYPSVEHAFQASKTLNREDRLNIAGGFSNPGDVKRSGRTLKLRKDWEEVKVDVMKFLVKQKFENPLLNKRLLATEGQTLIEGNTWGDIFWGKCRGEGENMLGKILMSVRDEFGKTLGG